MTNTTATANHAETRSFTVLNKYGVPISSAIYMMHNIWGIRVTDRDIFSQYYLLKWPVELLYKSIKEGTITRHGVTYQVIYHRTNYAELLKYTGDIFLSFRELQPEYEAYPTVLVTMKDAGMPVHTDL